VETGASLAHVTRPRVKPKKSVGIRIVRGIYRALLYLVVAAFATSMILPMIWMISTAFKEPGVILTMPPRFLPDRLYLGNFPQVFAIAPFGLFYLNSVKISVLSTLGQIVSCSMAAFAFARLRFPGKAAVFAVLIATIMVPFHVTLIPTFAIMRWLGWIDKHASLIVPAWFGAAFGIFFLRQHFLTIPQELFDSARIDGASYFVIYWRMFMPLVAPALATLAVLNFMWSWNDLIGPLIFLSSLEKLTVTLGLTFFKGQLYFVLWGPLMAATTLSVIPTLLLFVAAQKYFVQGVIWTGLKG
jgi:multiple sugar transport system permease protein